MKYAVLGFPLVNNIVDCEGNRTDGIIGGGGFYAFTGLRMVEAESDFLTAAGPDYFDYYGEWYDRNGVGRNGYKVKLDETIVDSIEYDREGAYHSFGPVVDFDALFMKSGLTGDEIREFTDDMKGMYTQGPWLKHSPGLDTLRHEKGFKTMWEYTEDPSCKERLADYLANVDIWSLNKPEAFRLFGVDSLEAAIREIRSLGTPCFFRDGTRGSYYLDKYTEVFAPPVLLDGKLGCDATGCGNSSTAAAMWAFSEGYSPLDLLVLCNTVAAFNARQYGPVPMIDDRYRDELFSTYKLEREKLN